MNSTDPDSRPVISRERPGVVSFRELTGGLVWPLLGRSLGQSVRLVHLCIGTLLAVAVFGGAWLLDRAWEMAVQGWFGMEDWASPFAMFSAFWPTGGREQMLDRATAFAYWMENSGWVSGVVLILALVVLSVGLGAISRSTAMSISGGHALGVREALRFAFSRVQALAVAVLVPSVLIGGLLIVIALVRLLLFTAEFMQPIGATLFVLPLLMGFVAAILAVLFAAGHGMLAPAVGVQNTDGVDAVQRSWGYSVARPIRFVFYLGVGVVILAGSYWLFQTICRLGIGFAMRSVPDSMQADALRDPGYATNAIAFWVQVLWLLFIGWVISFYGCASTIVYLLMRLACDEQDVTVIWTEPAAVSEGGGPSEPVEPDSDLEL